MTGLPGNTCSATVAMMSAPRMGTEGRKRGRERRHRKEEDKGEKEDKGESPHVSF